MSLLLRLRLQHNPLLIMFSESHFTNKSYNNIHSVFLSCRFTPTTRPVVRQDKNEKIVSVNKTGGPELRRLNAIESNNTTVGE